LWLGHTGRLPSKYVQTHLINWSNKFETLLPLFLLTTSGRVSSLCVPAFGRERKMVGLTLCGSILDLKWRKNCKNKTYHLGDLTFFIYCNIPLYIQIMFYFGKHFCKCTIGGTLLARTGKIRVSSTKNILVLRSAFFYYNYQI
jgi:hypothetical protein